MEKEQAATNVAQEVATPATKITANAVKTVSLTILEAKQSKNGELTLITRPTANNPKGVWIMRGGQTASVLRNAGVPNIFVLLALIGAGGSKLTFQTEEVKEGQAFVDNNTGEEKFYTKDWTKEFGHSVELSGAIKAKMADKALEAMFAAPVSAPQPVYSGNAVAKQPVVDTHEDEIIADPNIGG